MEKIVRQSMLYDFYGELLTDHQKSIYEDVVINDLSYSEIARLNGISRQGVFDIIKRCDKILEDYENKLKLVDRFLHAREKTVDIKAIINEIMSKSIDDETRGLLEAVDVKMTGIMEEF